MISDRNIEEHHYGASNDDATGVITPATPTDSISPSEEEIEAYASILGEIVSGFKAPLTELTEFLASLQIPGSDEEQRLIKFRAVVERVAFKQQQFKQIIKLIIKSYNGVVAVGRAIVSVVNKLRDIVEEFVKAATEKIKILPEKLCVVFGAFFQNVRDAVWNFMSWLGRVVSSFHPSPLVTIATWFVPSPLLP